VSGTHQLEADPGERLVFGDSFEEFDRVQFALRVLRLLSPPRMTVAVYECQRQRVESGRDPSRGPNATWGVLGVPRRASRQHIVLAVAELAGMSDLPYVVDLLSQQPPTAALRE
jgi:hypothetical protein